MGHSSRCMGKSRLYNLRCPKIASSRVFRRRPGGGQISRATQGLSKKGQQMSSRVNLSHKTYSSQAALLAACARSCSIVPRSPSSPAIVDVAFVLFMFFFPLEIYIPKQKLTHALTTVAAIICREFQRQFPCLFDLGTCTCSGWLIEK